MVQSAFALLSANAETHMDKVYNKVCTVPHISCNCQSIFTNDYHIIDFALSQKSAMVTMIWWCAMYSVMTSLIHNGTQTTFSDPHISILIRFFQDKVLSYVTIPHAMNYHTVF